MNRRRFQVHLSTAVLLMLGSGMFMWVNYWERRTKWLEARWGEPVREYWIDVRVRGWPAPLIAVYDDGSSADLAPFWFRVTVNSACLLLVLLPLGFASEWIIRKKALKDDSG